MRMALLGKQKIVIILACVMMAPRCSVYFNTYYNAEMAYKEARSIHEKAMRAFPDSLLTTPCENARTKYDRAIEKAIKVLDVFPRDKKWHDDAVFLLGKSYFYKNEMGKALRRFRELREEYQQSPYIPESYLYCAKAYILDGNLPKAEETLKYALDRYPFLDKDQKISLLLVEIELRREGKLQAIHRLEQARSSVRSQQLQIDLLLRVAELYMEMKRYDQAIALLRKAPRNKKDPFQEYRIDRNLVSCWVAVDSLQRALGLLKTMRTKKQFVPYKKEILFITGRILESTGDIEEAISCFKQVIGPGDSVSLASDTSVFVSKAWFELGQLYQRHKGNFKEAEKYYKLASERQIKDSGITLRAKARLDAIARIRTMRASLEAGDTSVTRPEGLFKIGELFYFELGEPDSACRQFLLIASDSVADTLFAPKALFTAAYIHRNSLKDSLRADSLYRRVIRKFPGTDFARKAQEAIHASTIVKTRSELSAAAFREAEKTYLVGNDSKAAVQAYYNVYRQYSDCAIAPKSLFAAAWITDNELQKKKVAKSLYEKICERYPKSGYCVDEAQPRLKVVLDTLEALRQQAKKADKNTAAKASAASTPAAPAAATTPSVPAAADTGVLLSDSAASTTPSASPAPAPEAVIRNQIDSVATADTSMRKDSVAAESAGALSDTIPLELQSDTASGPQRNQ